jgi:hypothetical protein
MEFIKDVCLESIIKHLLTMEKRGEHRTSWSWFIVIFSCINIPSLEGARYILTFIDDLSHFTWFILSRIRILSLKISKNLEPLLKINVVDPSSV